MIRTERIGTSLKIIDESEIIMDSPEQTIEEKKAKLQEEIQVIIAQMQDLNTIKNEKTNQLNILNNVV